MTGQSEHSRQRRCCKHNKRDFNLNVSLCRNITIAGLHQLFLIVVKPFKVKLADFQSEGSVKRKRDFS